MPRFCLYHSLGLVAGSSEIVELCRGEDGIDEAQLYSHGDMLNTSESISLADSRSRGVWSTDEQRVGQIKPQGMHQDAAAYKDKMYLRVAKQLDEAIMK